MSQNETPRERREMLLKSYQITTYLMKVNQLLKRRKRKLKRKKNQRKRKQKRLKLNLKRDEDQSLEVHELQVLDQSLFLLLLQLLVSQQVITVMMMRSQPNYLLRVLQLHLLEIQNLLSIKLHLLQVQMLMKRMKLMNQMIRNKMKMRIDKIK